MSIGFIGCGNMATAIISGIINNGVDAQSINVFDVFEGATNNIKSKYNVNVCNSECDVVKCSDTVILAVKPNVLESVLTKVDSELSNSDKLLISIAAGKTTEFIGNCLSNQCRIIRVMPNINATVGQAICGYTANTNATDNDKKTTEEIFSSVGNIIYLDENFFSLFGVLGGCSPAMVYMFIDELARAGVKNGMTKEQSLKIASQAVYGSAKMIMESDLHPYELIDKVCSPGGTTIEAITSLQENGFASAIHNAVDKAIEKDKKL